MAIGPPNGASSQYTEYQRLAAEYRACEVSCRASLDQLHAAARELKASGDQIDGDVERSAPAEIERAMHQLSDQHGTSNTAAIESLSPRERNVFELIGQGLPTGAIAECLHIAVSTVETYRERLKTKLKLDTGLELTRYAILWFARK